MNKSINQMIATTVIASSLTLMSYAEPIAVTESAAQIVAVKNAKSETVQLVLTGLK